MVQKVTNIKIYILQASVKGETKNVPTFQERMERVWTSLHIPDTIKLDMAIKYSSEPFVDSLEEVRRYIIIPC